MDEESLKKLKVTELKALLQGRSLPVFGKKEELVQRLLSHEEQTAEAKEIEKKPEEEAYISLKSESPAKKESKGPNAVPKVVKSPILQEMRKGEGPATAIVEKPKIDDQINARRARFGQPNDSKSASALSTPISTPSSTPSSIHSSIKTEETEEGLVIRSGKGKQTMEMVIGADEMERIKARQARFGTNAPILSHLESAERIAERKRRFSAGPQTKPADDR